MEILKNIEIENFSRVIWANSKCKEIWEKVISDCSQLVQDLELLSVIYSQRDCAWRTIDLLHLEKFSQYCGENGLIVLPIKNVGKWEGFSHRTPKVRENEIPNVYCIISKDIKKSLQFRDAYLEGNHKIQGKLLGFPDCCIDFFCEQWGKEYFDPIWQIGENSKSIEVKDNEIMINKFHPFSNPILRYIGIRIGFHLPCSFNCLETVKKASDRIKLRDKNIIKLLIALLSMPIEWSINKGIALIKTPILYVETSSIVTSQKYTVSINGKFIPRESPRGIKFPYNLKKS